MFAPKTILVPTDFSEYSDKAVRMALDIAKQYHSLIFLLHVIPLVIQCSEDYCLDPHTIGQLDIEAMAGAKGLMEKQLNQFPNLHSVAITSDIRQGTPYEEIIKCQREKNADLIVMASHGRTGLKHYFLGSVAERVSRDSTVPVLLVKKKNNS